jgi:S-adenosylmethionine:tRNA ribosyltransferase-isomerase
MQTSLFDYHLPPESIAQQPAEPRASSRLLVLERATGQIEHRRFAEIGDYLASGDLLVANNSRVIPARLNGRKTTGGAVEIFLLCRLDEDGSLWECLVRGKKLEAGVVIALVSRHAAESHPMMAEIVAVEASGTRTVRFSSPLLPALSELGETPLPPYITSYHGDPERYQTVYSQPLGSVAAPTAGLHFTPELLFRLRQQGVGFEPVTLHVGLDTFKPVTTEQIEEHQIHSEWAEVSRATAQRINEVSLQGRRIIAVGTTTARTLEWASGGQWTVDSGQLSVVSRQSSVVGHQPDVEVCSWQRVRAFAGNVSLFIRPGYRFRAVDGLITNFHLPRSSLLMMVSALIAQAHPDDPDAGRQMLLATYEVAKQAGYRFFSFGDAMLIL